MAERVRLHSWDAAAETIRRSLDAILLSPRAIAPAAAATVSTAAPGRVEAASVKVAARSVAKHLDDDPTALRKVASAG